MIESIEISEGCYGPNVSINGESLTNNDPDEENNETILNLRKKLVNELLKNLNNISTYDLRIIAEIVTTISDDYEIDTESIDEGSRCGQCGTYCYYIKYINTSKDNE